MSKITIIAHPTQTSDNGEGDTYLERRIEASFDDQRVVTFICDPDADWASRDQWISDSVVELIEQAALTVNPDIDRASMARVVAAVGREMWGATSSIRIDLDVADYV